MKLIKKATEELLRHKICGNDMRHELVLHKNSCPSHELLYFGQFIISKIISSIDVTKVFYP